MPRTGGAERRTTLVEEAIRQFGREGYAGASLDDIAGAVGVRKQTLLYYFPTKDALLEACLQAAGVRLAEVIAQALEGKEGYWERAEAVIHAVFGLAAEWPEFPMFVREAGRLGPGSPGDLEAPANLVEEPLPIHTQVELWGDAWGGGGGAERGRRVGQPRLPFGLVKRVLSAGSYPLEREGPGPGSRARPAVDPALRPPPHIQERPP